MNRLILSLFIFLPVLATAADIDEFVERREICDHLRGEFPDPPNAERAKEIIEGIKEYCAGTDAQLAALKIRFADSPSVMDKLNVYEPHIEREKKRSE